MQAYDKQLLTNLVLHEETMRYFRKPIRRAVASWVIPQVRFLPERAGYKREHPKLTYNKTCRSPQHLGKHLLLVFYDEGIRILGNP
jgi:hypothetical protein